jgi:hypothetical protein
MLRFQSFPDKAGERRIVFHNKNSHESHLRGVTVNRFSFSTESHQRTR